VLDALAGVSTDGLLVGGTAGSGGGIVGRGGGDEGRGGGAEESGGGDEGSRGGTEDPILVLAVKEHFVIIVVPSDQS
jgi:hypothetical protein